MHQVKLELGGRRLTRRALPLEDLSVDALGEVERDAVAAMWEGRAAAELRAARFLHALAGELFAASAGPVVLAMTARAVADEVRHAEIARRVAERYRGAAIAWPAAQEVALPSFDGASPSTTLALRVALVTSIAESVASAYLESSRALATAKLARAALSELLEDEIEHARIGYAFLANARDEQRRAMEPHLPGLLDGTLHVWTTQGAARAPGGVPSHGLPSDQTTRAVVLDAIENLVVPGLAAIDVHVAWRAP